MKKGKDLSLSPPAPFFKCYSFKKQEYIFLTDSLYIELLPKRLRERAQCGSGFVTHFRTVAISSEKIRTYSQILSWCKLALASLPSVHLYWFTPPENLAQRKCLKWSRLFCNAYHVIIRRWEIIKSQSSQLDIFLRAGTTLGSLDIAFLFSLLWISTLSTFVTWLSCCRSRTVLTYED